MPTLEEGNREAVKSALSVFVETRANRAWASIAKHINPDATQADIDKLSTLQKDRMKADAQIKALRLEGDDIGADALAVNLTTIDKAIEDCIDQGLLISPASPLSNKVQVLALIHAVSQVFAEVSAPIVLSLGGVNIQSE